jgi:hypothetical protein
MWRRIKLACVAALGVTAAMAQDGRSIGFAVFEVPGLRFDKAAQVVDGGLYVEHVNALSWAVLETNRLELQHGVDFAVLLMDFCVFTADPKEAAADVARLARGLTVKRIYLVAGPCLRNEETRSRYSLFVAALKASMPGYQVVDLSGKTERRDEFTLIGLNTVALTPDGDSGPELPRVERDMADGKTALLFAVIEKLPKDGKLDARSLWTGKRWASIVTRPNLAGVFLSVLSETPQTGPWFPAPGKEVPLSLVRVTPRLDPAVDNPIRGLLYARAARNGKAAAAASWMALPGEPLDLENVLREAGLNEEYGEYKPAFDLYKEALKSKDVHVRARAAAGLRRTYEALQGSWEQWKSELAPARWVNRHWPTAALLATLLLGFLVYRWNISEARVDMATKLGTDAPTELFMIHMIDAAKVIPAIWGGIPASLPGRKGLDVTLETEPGKNVAEELEGLKIPGVDVQAILKWLLFIWRYASWRLEMRVFGTATRAVVYARLRFAWYTRRVYTEPISTTGPMDVRAAAWTLICDLIVDRVRLK